MTYARKSGRDDTGSLRLLDRHAMVVAVVEAGWLLFLVWMAARGG